MNGEYLVAGAGGKHAPFNTNYADYPLASAAASSNEFFEVRSSPIRSNYGQVYWTMMPPIALEPDFVKRFDGKTIALTGYEVRRSTSLALRVH
jgi:hypothetical protein